MADLGVHAWENRKKVGVWFFVRGSRLVWDKKTKRALFGMDFLTFVGLKCVKILLWFNWLFVICLWLGWI